MRRFFAVAGSLALFAFTASAVVSRGAARNAPPSPSPADGYNIHVLAPHVVDGHVSGPYHHYCKVLAGEPQIVCLIYTSTDSNAMLEQVEFIMAKPMVRTRVTRSRWNERWHDHTLEIASGRVQVLDMPPDQARGVADLVSTTDGLIVHFYFDRGLPTGRTSVAQAVGHRRMSLREWNAWLAKGP